MQLVRTGCKRLQSNYVLYVMYVNWLQFWFNPKLGKKLDKTGPLNTSYGCHVTFPSPLLHWSQPHRSRWCLHIHSLKLLKPLDHTCPTGSAACSLHLTGIKLIKQLGYWLSTNHALIFIPYNIDDLSPTIKNPTTAIRSNWLKITNMLSNSTLDFSSLAPLTNWYLTPSVVMLPKTMLLH